MIALILGGSPDVWDDLAAAEALLTGRRHLIVAANLAGIHHAGHLDGWASLHSDLIGSWLARRRGNQNVRLFTPTRAPDIATNVIAERWPGSSGLYAAQIAHYAMGATAAILCGVPMDSEAGHFCDPGPWAGTADYRQAFAEALTDIGGRTRAMGGWTAELYGRPTAAWVAAVDNIRPLGQARPDQRRRDMHKVTNSSEGTLSFWARNPDGADLRVHLQPGESGDFEINPDEPQFQGAGVAVKAVAPAAAAAPAPSASPPGHRPLRAPDKA